MVILTILICGIVLLSVGYIIGFYNGIQNNYNQMISYIQQDEEEEQEEEQIEKRVLSTTRQ